MIRKLKIKFIALAMTALFVLLFLIVAGMNMINYHSVVKESDDVLMLLSRNKGNFPDFDDDNDNGGDGSDDFSDGNSNSNDAFSNSDNSDAFNDNGNGSDDAFGDGRNNNLSGNNSGSNDNFSDDNDDDDNNSNDDFDEMKKGEFPPDISPETPYESRYFFVLLNTEGNVIQTNTSKIKAVDIETAIEYAQKVLDEKNNQGFIENYRFMRTSEDTAIRITFLDCGRKLHSFRTFLLASIGMALVGFITFFFAILFFSGKIIRPITESYEKQKRFITDAGHEIKTPLTIIKADVDVLEMEFGENEWLEDIQKQAKRLTSLTNDLVYLSRMEESNDTMQMIEFPFSDVVSETAISFQALAQTQNKLFRCNIQPMLSLTGNEKAIRQLVNLLLDNALKYSPTEGIVALNVEKQGRQIRMTVFNTTEIPIPKEKLNLIFERFYRMDSSRSTQTGGYGIGLSVAKAIVSAHNGKIRAATQDGQSLEITVQLPV